MLNITNHQDTKIKTTRDTTSPRWSGCHHHQQGDKLGGAEGTVVAAAGHASGAASGTAVGRLLKQFKQSYYMTQRSLSWASPPNIENGVRKDAYPVRPAALRAKAKMRKQPERPSVEARIKHL